MTLEEAQKILDEHGLQALIDAITKEIDTEYAVKLLAQGEQ